MNRWEKKIIDVFIDHYFASVSDTEDDRKTLRIRSSVLFPNFDTANTDEKESFLEAAESLERKGLVHIRWEKRSEGERLKTLSCENFEMLFEEANRPFPKIEAEKIKEMLGVRIREIKKSSANEETAVAAESVIAFLEFFSLHFGPREIGQGINLQIMEEFIRLLEFSLESANLEKITTRALSILLYRDSKHLEDLLALCTPLIARAHKAVPSPEENLRYFTSSSVRYQFLDFSSLERSYPESLISGKIIIEFKNSKTPMVNAEGHIIGFPLESAEEIIAIQPVSTKEEKNVLTIENKETFYALGTPQKHAMNENFLHYDCFLYTGGYPNRAAVALIKILASYGFSFYHTGDLDPDGILILQNIQDIAEKPVTPVRMDTATFDQYQAWGRTLTKPMLRQIEKIKEETKVIPCLAALLLRIEETGLGVEQEIIDYR